MSDDQLNLDGNDILGKEVMDSYEALKASGEIEIVDSDEREGVASELFTAIEMNIFRGNTSIQNCFKQADCYYFQIMRNDSYLLGRQWIFTEKHCIFGLKRYDTNGIGLGIEPKEDLNTSFVAKLLGKIFSSNDVVISGHEEFNKKYRVYSTDKKQANLILSDSFLELIAGYDGLHFSMGNAKLIAWFPELSANSTAAVTKIFAALT